MTAWLVWPTVMTAWTPSGYSPGKTPRTKETAEVALSFATDAPKLEIDPDLVEIRGGKRMLDRRSRLVVLLVPRAGPPVQVRNLIGPLVPQVRLQDVGEELVIAIPPAAVIERDQEQVSPLQRRQLGLATVLAGDGIAQRAA